MAAWCRLIPGLVSTQGVTDDSNSACSLVLIFIEECLIRKRMYFLFGEVRVTLRLSWRLAWCSKQWILMLSLRPAPLVGLRSWIISRKDATCVTCNRKAIPSLHFRSTEFRKACAGLYQGFLGTVLYPFLKGIVIVGMHYHGPLACDYLTIRF